MSNDLHKNKYKNAGLDSEETRKQRRKENVTLGKQKGEQQVRKIQLIYFLYTYASI